MSTRTLSTRLSLARRRARARPGERLLGLGPAATTPATTPRRATPRRSRSSPRPRSPATSAPAPAASTSSARCGWASTSGTLRGGPGDRAQGRRSSRAGSRPTRPAGSPPPSCRQPRATGSTGTAVDADGLKKGYESGFRTRTLTLDEQTYPSFVPVDGPDGRRRHAGDHPVRRTRHRQGLDREAPQGGQPAGPGGLLPLDQRPGGALAPAHLLEARHRRDGQGRHRRRPGRQRHLRPEGPHA